MKPRVRSCQYALERRYTFSLLSMPLLRRVRAALRYFPAASTNAKRHAGITARGGILIAYRATPPMNDGARIVMTARALSLRRLPLPMIWPSGRSFHRRCSA